MSGWPKQATVARWPEPAMPGPTAAGHAGQVPNAIAHPREARSSAARTGSTPWARIFAALYEPFLWTGERTTLRRLRNLQLSRAYGRTLEIGAGTGLNLVHYPADLDELVLVEPDASMRAHLARAVASSDLPLVQVLDGAAEQLPFPDGSLDTVISTLVLCTVDAPVLALREISRVLRPGGQLIFIEHVRSATPAAAHRQDLLARPWRQFARGCRCNQDTEQLISASGLVLGPVQRASWRGMPGIVRPLVVGRATRPPLGPTDPLGAY